MAINFVKRANARFYADIEKRMNRLRDIEHIPRETAQRKRAYTQAINLHQQAITRYFDHCEKFGFEIRND